MAYIDMVIPSGTKVVFKAHAGMAGTDTAEFYILSRTYRDSELSNEAWLFGKDHAEMYGIYPINEYTEEEVEEDPDSYSENIEGWYEIYNPEDHDGLRISGCSAWYEI